MKRPRQTKTNSNPKQMQNTPVLLKILELGNDQIKQGKIISAEVVLKTIREHRLK